MGDDELTVPTTAIEAEAVRLRVSLRPICWQLGQTVDLLRGSNANDDILTGRWQLEEVHDLLGALASDQPVPDLAARLGRIRDSLAGHLVAAVDCGIAGVRPEVIADMLCRGASMVSADLNALV